MPKLPLEIVMERLYSDMERGGDGFRHGREFGDWLQSALRLNGFHIVPIPPPPTPPKAAD